MRECWRQAVKRDASHALAEGKRDVKILYGLRFFSKCMGKPV